MLGRACVSLQQLWFPVANGLQDTFSPKIVRLQTEMGWLHQIRPLSFNSMGMLKNGSGEPELLGMFGTWVLPTTLVSSGQSTARHLFIKDCAVSDGNELATSGNTPWTQLSGHAQKCKQRTRVVGQIWRPFPSNNSGFQWPIHSKTSFHQRLCCCRLKWMDCIR